MTTETRWVERFKKFKYYDISEINSFIDNSNIKVIDLIPTFKNHGTTDASDIILRYSELITDYTEQRLNDTEFIMDVLAKVRREDRGKERLYGFDSNFDYIPTNVGISAASYLLIEYANIDGVISYTFGSSVKNPDYYRAPGDGFNSNEPRFKIANNFIHLDLKYGDITNPNLFMMLEHYNKWHQADVKSKESVELTSILRAKLKNYINQKTDK